MTVTELLPLRPRRSSAGTRRHHRKYVPHRIALLAPGADQIRITPVYWAGQPSEGVWRVFVFDARGRSLNLPGSESPRLIALLQGAFTADWTRPQTWVAATNELLPDPPVQQRRAA
ncbi:MAG TPA: hypothetical protein DEQ61_08395 [Streptomyces sp.]|nr:hypothetical protein [Streptomyces sp.]